MSQLPVLGVPKLALTLIETWNVTDSGEARVSAALALTIGEQFHSMLCLLDNHCETHAAAPIRSMLEGLADLILLAADPQYVIQMRFDNAKTDSATIENYQDSIGSDAPSEMVSELASLLKQAGTTRQSLKDDGLKRQTREDKFKLTGNNHLYVAYGVMCS